MLKLFGMNGISFPNLRLMKALVLNGINEALEFKAVSDPIESADMAVVEIKAAALNHRDLFITQGLYANIKTPCILGADGAGLCGGKAVLLYPALDWGDSQYFQGNNFRVLGMPEDGTFAEKIALPVSSIFPAPAHLSFEQAAALPLAGLTAWRTVFSRCQLKKGEKVLVSGIGGGVALMAMQLALAVGAEVYVTSGSVEKIEQAKDLGAKHGENYREADWHKRLKAVSGGFDVIIDSAGGDGFALFPSMCNPGARIGFYGATLGKVNGLSMQPLFWKQISILGSTMGSPDEFKEMLAFVAQHEIVPVVDEVFELVAGNRAFEKMKQGGQFGKLVISI